MFLGLRTVIYPTTDLQASKKAFSELLGLSPYFDEPFYVGFNIGGYELGLNPAAEVSVGPVTYWGVPEITTALQTLVSNGATVKEAASDVGGGIKVATVTLPGGFLLGIIENPNFTIPAIENGGPGL